MLIAFLLIALASFVLIRLGVPPIALLVAAIIVGVVYVLNRTR